MLSLVYLRRYLSDIVMLAACLAFAFYLVAEACQPKARIPAWDNVSHSLALADR